MQQQFGLAVEPDAPLLGVVSRLTSQKGLDLVLSVLPELIRMGGQLVVQGTGEAALEAAFRMAASAHPGRVGVLLGYDEIGAHRLIAGADMILVPSRFEPCGLTQMYGLRYGTVPIVRRVGGLADTVRDVGRETGAAPGQRLRLRRRPTARRCRTRWPVPSTYIATRSLGALMQRGMGENLSWDGPAKQYMTLYEHVGSEHGDARRKDLD